MTHYSEIEATQSRIEALRAKFGADNVDTPTTGKVWVHDVDVTDLVEAPSADLDVTELVERVEQRIGEGWADDDLVADERHGEWTVVDGAGGRWWPHDPISSAEEALRVCREEPGRGKWVC